MTFMLKTEPNRTANTPTHWLPREGVVILKTKNSLCNSFLLIIVKIIKIIPASLIWNEERTFLGWFSVKVRTCFLIISLTQAQQKAGLHTHTLTWNLLLGWIGSWEILEVVISVRYKTKAWRRQKFLNYVVMSIFLMLLMFVHFAWGQANIQVRGSLISQ